MLERIQISIPADRTLNEYQNLSAFRDAIYECLSLSDPENHIGLSIETMQICLKLLHAIGLQQDAIEEAGHEYNE